MYGVWHPYKHSMEMTYKAFSPIVKFLEQGWDLKVGAVVPLKVKLRHMEKTIVGSPTLQSWGQYQKWSTNGWIGYITPAFWGSPTL